MLLISFRNYKMCWLFSVCIAFLSKCKPRLPHWSWDFYCEWFCACESLWVRMEMRRRETNMRQTFRWLTNALREMTHS